jgi:hypothetical protein
MHSVKKLINPVFAKILGFNFTGYGVLKGRNKPYTPPPHGGPGFKMGDDKFEPMQGWCARVFGNLHPKLKFMQQLNRNKKFMPV